MSMNILQERLSKYNYLELDLVLSKLNKNNVVFIKYAHMNNTPKINVLVLYKFSWSEYKYWITAWLNEIKQALNRKQSTMKTLVQLFNNSLWKREIFFWIWSLETSESRIAALSLENNLLPEDVPNSLITQRLSQEAYEIQPGLWCENIEPTSILINNQSFPYVEGKTWDGEALNEVVASWCEKALNKKIKVINI